MLREAGADAVLLLLRDLDDEEVTRLMGRAAELGLDTLVEAHDSDELERPSGSAPTRSASTHAISGRSPSTGGRSWSWSPARRATGSW